MNFPLSDCLAYSDSYLLSSLFLLSLWLCYFSHCTPSTSEKYVCWLGHFLDTCGTWVLILVSYWFKCQFLSEVFSWPLFWNINPYPYTDSLDPFPHFILLSIYCPNTVMFHLFCCYLLLPPWKLHWEWDLSVLFTATNKTILGTE